MRAAAVTMKDIAQRLGISISTVNRALLGKGRINPHTKDLILRTAQEMGYQTNVLAKTLSSREMLRIAVICPSDMFFVQTLVGIEACYKEIRQFRVELVFRHQPDFDVAAQVKELEACADGSVHGVLLAAAHASALNENIERLERMGIPVVCFNNDAPESRRHYFVGQDPRVAGRMAGELLCRMLPAGSRIAMLSTYSAGLDVTTRRECFLEAALHSGHGHELVGVYEHYDFTGSSVPVALHVLKTVQADAIYASNMEGTLALGRALKEYIPEKKPFIIGHDSDEELENYIREDKIDVSLLQDPFGQGYYALKLLFELLYYKRSVLDPVQHVRTTVLLKSNLGERDILANMLDLG